MIRLNIEDIRMIRKKSLDFLEKFGIESNGLLEFELCELLFDVLRQILFVERLRIGL